MKTLRCLLIGVTLLYWSQPAQALGPDDVYILVNSAVRESREVAEHYADKRGVPRDHVVALNLPKGEDINRRDYNRWLLGPLREALHERREKVKILLTVYGVPLRVGRQESSAEERRELARLQPQITQAEAGRRKLQEQIAALEARRKIDPAADIVQQLTERRKERDQLASRLKDLEARQRLLSHAESEASVDSELSLMWWDNYDLNRWQLNPLYFRMPPAQRKGKLPVVMVSRLDGPSIAIVKKLVDQAVNVEARGLEGKVYVDARGIKYNPTDNEFGYSAYDESLREMARVLERDAKMPVTLDDKPELFAPGSCPECALYCGWYSLANYIDCCRFVPGAVAYHIASSEAVSLRDPQSKLWCKSLLQHGVAATLGPVAEPYAIGFPKPSEFFSFLATGKYTLVECYYKTSLFNSWMTVLVGDPLYKPYAKKPRLREDQVKPSPLMNQPSNR